MKVLLRPRIYAFWDEKSTSGPEGAGPDVKRRGWRQRPSVTRS